MRVYVKGVPELEVTTTLTDKELIVLIQAFQRGLITGKIRVNYYRGERYLELAAIDVTKTLPNIIFEKPSILPPPLLEALPIG